MFNAYIDRSAILQNKYREPQQLDSYIFVICTHGSCRVNIYTSDYTINSNNLITLLPNSYFRIIEQSPDTELFIVSFSQQTLSSADIFADILEHITYIIEKPVIEFPANVVGIICDYIKLLMRIKNQLSVSENSDFANSILKQFIIGLGAKYKAIEDKSVQTDRSRVLVTKLIKLIATHYSSKRSVSFYAQKINISPQHLSSVVSKMTNRTITDIIAMFVIIDAQTKLLSTDLSISEIATILNFDDISTFGRYFKRYTNLSPRSYRKR